MPIKVNRIEFALRTLTPLWMGDIDHDSAAPRETAVIGSLRHWYEGILRAQGVRACDGCELGACGDCPACELFGSTSSGRRFRLEIGGELKPVPVFFSASHAVQTATRGWLGRLFGEFKVKALWSDEPFSLVAYPRGPEPDKTLRLLMLVLCEAATKGGIGARTQFGFGQVSLEPLLEGKWRKHVQGLCTAARVDLARYPTSADAGTDLFTLHSGRFFSHLYTVANPPRLENIGKPPDSFDGCYIPCSFDIRYKYSAKNPRTHQGQDKGIRPEILSVFGDEFTKKTCGFSTGDEAQATRIHVSHLYRKREGGRYLLKIWGDVERKKEVEPLVEAHIKKRFEAGSPTKLA